VLRLPPGVDDAAIAARAWQARIRVPALSEFRIRPAQEGGLVIGYGRLHESAVEPAIRVLARIVEDQLESVY